MLHILKMEVAGSTETFVTFFFFANLHSIACQKSHDRKLVIAWKERHFLTHIE
jgi:hypothetical protein